MVLLVLLGHSIWHLYRKVIELNPSLANMADSILYAFKLGLLRTQGEADRQIRADP